MISFRQFERRARACFESIPPHFRERVLDFVVKREVREHDAVPGNYLLGECAHLPEWDGTDELRSTVYLYYGSFVRLHQEDPDFDMDAEIEETVLHEVQHHVEDSAGHGGLVGQDWAGEQNERRRADMPHADRFWRHGEKLPDEAHPTWGVDYDVFQEVLLAADAWEAAERGGLRLEALGRRVVVDPGSLPASPTRVTFEGYGRSLHGSGPGDLMVEVRRREGFFTRINPFSRSR